jgi:hypothetical protein
MKQRSKKATALQQAARIAPVTFLVSKDQLPSKRDTSDSSGLRGQTCQQLTAVPIAEPRSRKPETEPPDLDLAKQFGILPDQ